ncbi:sugar phosphate isomerase/epimerase family protein [Thalassotalea sp. PS06]|uniref:sugar phosphate isomerase/epimerase family protein n=1 Tax=Thalassotalea sp. PS06 TaxID=2594005 RepID=UPI001162F2CE|nr:sugar phosphate isomerase/epimerase [Thalassotalea sp. PS06]QDP00184.1 sugar phosphate isomerase/epimerase [Thalassotalea sp. PS06]
MKRVMSALVSVFAMLCMAVTSPLVMAKPAKTLPQVSVQLWSVKEDLAKDVDGTLTKLAELGFAGVEFAGEFGKYADNPEALKQKMDALGLTGSGAHVSFEQLNSDNIKQTVAFYRTLGVSYLIIGWDERAWDEKRIDEVVTLLNQAAEDLKAYDMQVGFHNHDHEFNTYQNATFWDYIARNTQGSVIMQQDVGWTTYAGKDPVEYVKRYPGRTQTTHYKVVAKDKYPDLVPLIGEGATDWPALVSANIEVGGTHWLVVEQEENPEGLTRMQAVEKSYQALLTFLQQYQK